MDAGTDWLDSHGAGRVAHPGGTLRDHLLRVADRLAAWQLPQAVQTAGLTHAAYGTAGFDDQLIPFTARAELRVVIGEDAENIVYQYGACDRSTSYPQFPGCDPFVLNDRFTGRALTLTDAETRAFVALTFANEIDVMQHNTSLAQKHGDALHALALKSQHWLPPAAHPDLPLLLPR
ncbi:DUF6817 domain-containing protein [Tsukamurella sp. PLM1]|uniref:DUF6817 domain-containing protein n=1 Tax=Tsukamurella sp. PLM1 TaxID=2929795 RepID=UPI0020BF172A|nr:hypothetical protein [Tsukamurella sp. PLM1]